MAHSGIQPVARGLLRFWAALAPDSVAFYLCTSALAQAPSGSLFPVEHLHSLRPNSVSMASSKTLANILPSNYFS